MTILARRVNNNNATTITSLASLPPSQCCLAPIPHGVMSLAMFPCLRPLSLSWRFLARVPCIVRSLAPSPRLQFSHLENKTIKYVVGGGVTNSSWPRQYDTKPSVGIIAHGVGVIPAHLAGASLGCWQWYGPKPLTTMISKKRDVSGETGAKKGHIKVS